jgi:hypothetical protein
MTKTLAPQAAALVLALVATLGAVTGVSGAAAHQRAVVESQATLVAMARSGAMQHVTLVGHRTQRA